MINAVILLNPFKPNERIVARFDAKEKNVKSILDVASLLTVEKPEEMDWFVNGYEKSLNDFVDESDYIVAVPRLGHGGSGKNIATIVAGIALIALTGGIGGAFAIGASKAIVLGNTLGMGLVMYGAGGLMMGNMKIPSLDVTSTDSSYEGGYNWNPGTINIKQGGALPITFGTVKTGGTLLNKSNDILMSSNFPNVSVTNCLNLILAASEGELTGIGYVKINSIGIETLAETGATYQAKFGGIDNNTPQTLFNEAVEDISVNAELPANSETWVYVTFTEPAKAGETTKFIFSLPSGFYKINEENGGLDNAIPLRIRIERRVVGSSTWNYVGNWVLEDLPRTRKPFFVYFAAEFYSEDYNKVHEFRFKNVTSDLPINAVEAIYLITAQITKPSQTLYPDTAYISLRLPASAQVSGSVPNISWTQTRQYIYAWNPTAGEYQFKDATNIAWIVYDLIHYARRRYDARLGYYVYEVEGEPADKISYSDFEQWAAFCAETVNGVPRGKGNLLLDSTEKLWPTIQEIASFGRAFVVQQAGIFKPVWEAAAPMTQIFTSGNIITGSLSGGYLSDEERATAIEATFLDEDNNFESSTILVQGDDYNPYNIDNATQIKVKVLTNRKAVYSYCRFLLRKNKYIRRFISFTADIDSIVAQIGDVIGVQSDVPTWGVGGRLLGATTTQVILDTDVNLEVNNNYRIIIRDTNTDQLIVKNVDAVNENKTTNTLYFTQSPFSTAPNPYEVYSFGELNTEIKPFRITSISRNGDLQANIEATEYIEGVYDDTESNIPLINYTQSSSRINSLSVVPNAERGEFAISWQPDLTKAYDGAVVLVDGKPQGFFSAEQTSFIIEEMPGEHTVKVIPVHGNEYGEEEETTVTLGQPVLASVSNVSLATVVEQQADQTNFIFISGTFTKPVTALRVLVEVKEGTSSVWTNIQNSSNTDFRYGPVKPLTNYTFRFTAVNNYLTSEAVTHSIVSNGDTTAPAIPTITASVVKNVTVGIEINLANPPSDMAGFRLYRNATYNNADGATLLGFLSAKDGKASFTDLTPSIGTYYYYAKSIDVWGNTSGFSSAATATTQAVVADEVAATALSIPTGAILRLSAKGCTTASIAQENGVIDVSGNGNHGQAITLNKYEIVFDNEMGYVFKRTSLSTGSSPYGSRRDSIELPAIPFDGEEETFSIRVKYYGETFVTGRFFGKNKNITAHHGLNANNQTIEITKAGKLKIYFGNGSSDGSWPLNYQLEINKVYTLTFTYNLGLMKFYVNGDLYASRTVAFTDAVSKSKDWKYYIGNYANNSSEFLITDIRVYPYALTSTQVKSLYMFPDEALFAQLTADLIGTNVINAKNLVKTQALITEVAQIDNSIIKNLQVTDELTIGDLNTTAQNALGTAQTASDNASQALTDASTANTKIDNLQVGGRNLLLDSKKGWTATSSFNPMCRVYYGDMVPINNDKVTVTIKVPSNPDFSIVEGIALYNSGGSYSLARLTETNYDSNKKVFTKTFSWIGAGSTTNSYLYIKINIKSGQTLSSFTIEWVKLEFGNQATTYSPAPEDTDSSISTAQSTADTAITNASTALTNAATAQQTANNANTLADTANTTANAANNKIDDSNENLSLWKLTNGIAPVFDDIMCSDLSKWQITSTNTPRVVEVQDGVSGTQTAFEFTNVASLYRGDVPVQNGDTVVIELDVRFTNYPSGAGTFQFFEQTQQLDASKNPVGSSSISSVLIIWASSAESKINEWQHVKVSYTISRSDAAYLRYRFSFNSDIDLVWQVQNFVYYKKLNEGNFDATVNTKLANANTALERINSVMTTNYTKIKGGSIATGIIASGSFDIDSYRETGAGVYGTPVYDSTNERYFGGTFTYLGSMYDLDYGEIHTPYFYSNYQGAGIKGYVEADSGKFGVLEIQPNGSIKSDVTDNTDYANDPGTIELTKSVFNPETGVYKRTDHFKSGCGFLNIETLKFTNSAYTTWDARQVYINSDSIKIAEWGTSNLFGTDKIKLFYNSGINKYGIVVGSNSDGYLTVNGDIQAEKTITDIVQTDKIENKTNLTGGAFLPNIYLGSKNDYEYVVIPLCNCNQAFLREFFLIGTLFTRYGQAANRLGSIDLRCFYSRWDTASPASNNRSLTKLNNCGKVTSFEFVTFIHNNLNYIGIRCQHTQALMFYFTGVFADNGQYNNIFANDCLIPYYNSNTQTVLNAEINNSIVVIAS